MADKEYVNNSRDADYYAALRASDVAKTVEQVARINHALSFVTAFDAVLKTMDKNGGVAQKLALIGWNQECKETIEETLWEYKCLLIEQQKRGVSNE